MALAGGTHSDAWLRRLVMQLEPDLMIKWNQGGSHDIKRSARMQIPRKIKYWKSCGYDPHKPPSGDPNGGHGPLFASVSPSKPPSMARQARGAAPAEHQMGRAWLSLASPPSYRAWLDKQGWLRHRERAWPSLLIGEPSEPPSMTRKARGLHQWNTSWESMALHLEDDHELQVSWLKNFWHVSIIEQSLFFFNKKNSRFHTMPAKMKETIWRSQQDCSRYRHCGSHHCAYPSPETARRLAPPPWSYARVGAGQTSPVVRHNN